MYIPKFPIVSSIMWQTIDSFSVEHTVNRMRETNICRARTCWAITYGEMEYKQSRIICRTGKDAKLEHMQSRNICITGACAELGIFLVPFSYINVYLVETCLSADGKQLCRNFELKNILFMSMWGQWGVSCGYYVVS